MYRIAVEIHGLRQLQRLVPSVVEELRRQIVTAAEVEGASFYDDGPSLWLFSFERAEAQDHAGVVDCLVHVQSLLTARESDLSGWTVYVDYLNGDRGAVCAQVRARLMPIDEINTVWAGETAAALLDHHFRIEEVGVGAATGLRILGRLEEHGVIRGSVDQIARNDDAIDQIIAALDPNETPSGILVVVGDDPNALRVNTRAALDALQPSDVDRLVANPDTGDAYAPIRTLFGEYSVHQTRFWLSSTEQRVWDDKRGIVRFCLDPSAAVLPDSQPTDLFMALQLYLISYARRLTSATLVPVVVCNEIDRWPLQSVEMLSRAVSQFDGRENAVAPVFVATAQSSALLTPFSSRARRVRVATPGITRIRQTVLEQTDEATCRNLNWKRLVRLSQSRADGILHYLSDAPHWEQLADDDVAAASPEELAWRVMCALDSDIKDLLLALGYVHGFMRRARLADLWSVIGVDDVRATHALARLRSLGLIEEWSEARLRYPQLHARLEASLGRAGRAVFAAVATVVVSLVERGSIRSTEETIRFIASYESGRYVPELYYRLVKRLLDERNVAEAQRLLYDAVPTAGFVAEAREEMQTVLAAGRLRLALLQGNMQAALRVRSTVDRISGRSRRCGDLTLQRSRLSCVDRPSKETTKLLKQSIVEYQDAGDDVGLCRANLDFGLVFLSHENVLDAREYVQMAGRSVGETGDVFERVRAARLTLLCEYVHGNLSRVLELNERLEQMAGDGAMRDVQLFCDLTRGRVEFELGRYEQAMDTFASGRSRARVYGAQPAERVMERWIARCHVYDGRVKRGLAILDAESEHSEQLFFIAEAYHRNGENGRAVAALDRATHVLAFESPAVESVSWSTGYSALEDYAIGATAGSRVLEHQILSLRGYLLAETGRVADGVHEMYRLTREMRISEIDPYNSLYFYLYSLILPESGELNLEDRTTVLGKAVRFIQQRTSRMDSYTHKTDFLRKNYWNAKLMAHAQISNLV